MRNALLFVLTVLVASLCHGAEVYPSKVVRVIVPFGPGTSADFVARLISNRLTTQLGKTFVVENRSGAGGVIAYGGVAKAAPDGYTLLQVDTSFSILASVNKSLPFDPDKDFTPIVQMFAAPNVFTVGSSQPNTLKEFIAAAQASPGKLNYGSSGVGSATHLAAELFKMAAKVNIVHVPFKGGTGDAIVALLGDQIQVIIPTIPAVITYINNGKLRALAVTTAKRSPLLPDVPTMSEAGIPSATLESWYGLAGPAGMPREAINTLRSEVRKALATPEVKERLLAQGAEVTDTSLEEFTKLMRSELQRWTAVVNAAGIVLEN